MPDDKPVEKPVEETPLPAAPVESPAVSANNMTTLPQPNVTPDEEDSDKGEAKATPKKTAAKKSSAKKTAAKKTTAKKTAAKKTTAKKSSAKKTESGDTETSVAQEILSGSQRWNTGRERDELVRKAGLDDAKVRAEISRLRGEELKNNG